MKLRNLFILIAGFMIGYQLGKRAAADDPNVVKGPQRQHLNGVGSNRAMRTVSAQAQRLADQATTKSLDAIKRTRTSIKDRLSNREVDDAVWN